MCRVGAHYLQGCRPELSCSDRQRTTVCLSEAIRPCGRRAFSPQTPVLYYRRHDRTGCSTDHHRLQHFSSSRSPHLEHATTARHLYLIVDCIQTASQTSSVLFLLPWTFPIMTSQWSLQRLCHIGHYKFSDWLIVVEMFGIFFLNLAVSSKSLLKLVEE